MRNKKSALTILSNAFFVIILMIIVFIILFVFFSSKTSMLEEKLYQSNVEYTNNMLSIYLNNQQCIAFSGANNQIPTQSLIDFEKVLAQDNKNRDLFCMPYFRGIAYVQILDTATKQVYNLTINKSNPKWADSIITSSMPIALYYSGNNIRLGLAKLTIYYGVIPDFYSVIKRATYFKQNFTMPLNNKYRIRYDNSTNIFCIQEDCFFAKFYCSVNSFEIPKGQHIIIMDYNNNSLQVKY